MVDYTPRVGYDTVKLNWDLGSDPTVFRMPSEHEWYGENPLPPPSSSDPLQESMKFKCSEVPPYGGGKYDLKNGERRLWRQADGVHYELRCGRFSSYLVLETSLPKLLFGHNKYPIPLDMLPEALDELTRRARTFIPSLPPCDELEAWRIDATSDVQLRSELEVGLVGRVLGDSVLNGALPTRYPTGGSLWWPVSGGFPGARCYGKSVQSGDEKLAGVYRSEVQVMGGKQFRKALGLAVENGDLSPELISGRGRRCVKAGTLASEKNVCTGLLDGLTGVLRSAIDVVREVNAVTAFEAIGLLERKAGVSRSRAFQLVGYSHAVRVLGWGFTGLNRKGVWEAKKAFEAAGVDPAFIDFSSSERLSAVGGMVAGGALLGGAAVAGLAIGGVLADALFPDTPKQTPKKKSEPEPVGGSDLDKAA